MFDLIEFYKKALEFVGMKADDDGLISMHLMGSSKDVTINGQRLCLPTDERLRNPGDLVFFHPLCESILYGESEVNERYRAAFNIRLNTVVVSLISNLLRIASSPALHDSLTPIQSKIITSLKDADDKLFTNFTEMAIKLVKESPDKPFVNLYVKRSGEIHGKHFARVGVVTFTFLDTLNEATDHCISKEKANKVAGVKLRTRTPNDAMILRNAYNIVFPGAGPTGVMDGIYNSGSDRKVAPFFDATLRSAMELARRVNDVIDIFSDKIAEADLLRFCCIDELALMNEDESELKRIGRLVPTLPFNEGRRKKDTATIAPNINMQTTLANAALSGVKDKPIAQPTQMANPSTINPAINPNHAHPTLSSVIQQPVAHNPPAPVQQPSPRSGRPTLSDVIGTTTMMNQAMAPTQQQRVPSWAIPNAQPVYQQPMVYQQSVGGVVKV